MPLDSEDSEPQSSDPSSREERETLSPAQRLAIIEEVQKRLDREHKTFRTAVGILALVLAALGIGTYADFRRQAKAIVRAEVDGLINRVDSDTSVRRTLNNLVSRSVMTASLIALRSPEPVPPNRKITLGPEKPERELNLSFDDWTRLQKWVRDEKLDLQDFSGSMVVLAAQDEERGRQDARDFLSEMLNPPAGSRYEWMSHQSAKRLAILRSFLRPGLETPALEIATSDDFSNELRSAALDYLKAVQARDMFDDLFSIVTKDGDDALALRALMACAWLDPLNAKIKQEMGKIVMGPSTPGKVEQALGLAAAIWYAPSSTNEKTAESIRIKALEERRSLAMQLLSYAFEGKRSRVVVLGGGIIAIIVESKDRPYEAFGVPKERFSQFEPYWMLLRNAAQKGDVARTSRLAPWSASQSGLNALQLELADSSSVTVLPLESVSTRASQLVLSRSAGVLRIVLARSKESEVRGNETMNVLWTDKSGQQRQGSLIALNGPEFEVSFPKEF